MPTLATPADTPPPTVEPEGAYAGAEDVPAVVSTGITTTTNAANAAGIVTTSTGSAMGGSLG